MQENIKASELRMWYIMTSIQLNVNQNLLRSISRNF